MTAAFAASQTQRPNGWCSSPKRRGSQNPPIQ
jgi:hypothetical protein